MANHPAVTEWHLSPHQQPHWPLYTIVFKEISQKMLILDGEGVTQFALGCTFLVKSTLSEVAVREKGVLQGVLIMDLCHESPLSYMKNTLYVRSCRISLVW